MNQRLRSTSTPLAFYPPREKAATTGAIRGWFRRVRLRQWAHLLPLPLATFDPGVPSSTALFAAGRGLATTFALLAFGYLLNAVSDRRMDRDVRKNPFIAPEAGEYRGTLVVLLAISVGLMALGPWPAQLATVSSLTFLCIYSTGPRLKSIPIAGSLSNLGNFAPLLFVGMPNTSLPPRFAYVVSAFAALLLQNQLIHEAADRAEDLAGGIRTTWLTLGPRWTALIAALSGLGATVAAAGIIPAVPATAVVVIVGTVFGAAFPLLLACRGVQSNPAARLRVAHRWCAVLFGAGLFTAWRWEAYIR